MLVFIVMTLSSLFVIIISIRSNRRNKETIKLCKRATEMSLKSIEISKRNDEENDKRLRRMMKTNEEYFLESKIRTKIAFQNQLFALSKKKEQKCTSCKSGMMSNKIKDDSIVHNNVSRNVPILGMWCNKCDEGIFDAPALSLREMIVEVLKLKEKINQE